MTATRERSRRKEEEEERQHTEALHDAALRRSHAEDTTRNRQQGSDGGFEPSDPGRFVDVLDGKVDDAPSIRYILKNRQAKALMSQNGGKKCSLTTYEPLREVDVEIADAAVAVVEFHGGWFVCQASCHGVLAVLFG